MQTLESFIESFRGKTVSLVGGAQSIYKNKYGNLIDSADLVIRMNRGFPKHQKNQGKRTDLLAISCDITRFQHWRYFKSAPIIWMSPNRQGMPVWMTKQKPLFFYSEQDWNALFNKLQRHRPSTGAMTLDFVCTQLAPSQLNLFGFDFKKTKTVYEKKQKLGPHNWDLEQTCALQRIQDARSQNLDWNIF